MNYNSIIIGFGKGGKTLAGALAAKGEKVAVIEQDDKMYGGTCINVGCLPSKSLVKNAAVSFAHKNADFNAKAQLYKNAVEEKRALTAMLRKKNYDKLASSSNITIIDGKASFVDENTVKVMGAAGTQEISGEKIFINTGSRSVVPNIDGVQTAKNVYYSDTLMDLDVLPKQLVIIGGGYIGLEFASMYASFGSDVTVLQDGERFLPREDEDIAHSIMQLLQAQGVSILLGTKINEISEDGTVHYEYQGKAAEQKADAVLVATGRRPNTDELNLEAANVKTTPRGAVQVNELMQTSQKNIWAMGDVTGGLQFTYISLDDYRIVARQLIGGNKYTSDMRKNVPYSVFMKTPFSRVGLNEEEARKAGFNIKTASMPTAAIPKAQVLKKTEGMLKAVIDADTNKVLGVMLLCEESYEMINIAKVCMDLNADYTYLRDNIYTHPTMSEAFNDLFNI